MANPEAEAARIARGAARAVERDQASKRQRSSELKISNGTGGFYSSLAEAARARQGFPEVAPKP